MHKDDAVQFVIQVNTRRATTFFRKLSELDTQSMIVHGKVNGYQWQKDRESKKVEAKVSFATSGRDAAGLFAAR